jgi:hypothetical protein
VSEQEEWEALLEEALMIPEPAEEKARRLLHLQRDILAEAPAECYDLAHRCEVAVKALCVDA